MIGQKEPFLIIQYTRLDNDATGRAYMVDRVVRLTPDVTVMPDVVVTCDRADQGDAFFLDSPSIVVEVLSKSTEARDRTYKLLRYQAKPSIQEIVLISQYVQHVEVITRTTSGWEYQEYGHEERFTLASLNATIRVSEIYRRLSIPIEKRTFLPLEIIEPAGQEPPHGMRRLGKLLSVLAQAAPSLLD